MKAKKTILETKCFSNLFLVVSKIQYIRTIMIQIEKNVGNGILLPKLFGPTVRKNCSSDRKKIETENLQKF